MKLYVLPLLSLVICFPELSTSYMFFPAWHRLYVSRVWQQLYVFPRLAPAKCFPTLCICRAFSYAWRQSHVHRQL